MAKRFLVIIAALAAGMFIGCSNNDPIEDTDIDTTDTIVIQDDTYVDDQPDQSDMFDEAVTDDIVSDNAVTDEIQTDDIVSDDVVTDEVVTDDVVTDDIATDEVVTDDIVTDDILPDVDTVVPCTAENCVYFSEYIEGTASNKAIEVYNGSTGAIDPAKYRVRLFPNGASGANATLVLNACNSLTTLAAGAMAKIANGLAGATLKNAATCTHGVTDYNGDDALTLEYTANGTDWTVIDRIGVAGTDPGTAWAVAGTADATAEHTLVRKAHITQGTTDWTASAGTSIPTSQWTVNAQDDFTGFGIR